MHKATHSAIAHETTQSISTNHARLSAQDKNVPCHRTSPASESMIDSVGNTNIGSFLGVPPGNQIREVGSSTVVLC